MVSRRNFLTIATMFLILFFMFQFTGVMKERLNEYGTNMYAAGNEVGLAADSAYSAALALDKVQEKAQRSVYCVGAADGELREVTGWWCAYTKRGMSAYAALEECVFGEDQMPEIVVIDGTVVDSQEEVLQLCAWAEQGVSMIFAGLPDSEFIRGNRLLMDLLGISQVLPQEAKLCGMHVFDHFLIGGEAIYKVQRGEDEKRQDFEMQIPWYVTGSGTKTYMIGMLDDNIYDERSIQMLTGDAESLDETSRRNSVQPAVIWRHGMKNAKIFCVNGDYLNDISGIGILDALMAEYHTYEIYPVVNAQNLVIADFPAFTSENEEVLQEKYSQSALAVYREIVWPSLSAMATQTGYKMTCLVTPQFDYDYEGTLEVDEAEYYFRLLSEARGEIGWSTTCLGNVTAADKFQRDLSFWQACAPDYEFRSLYMDDSSEPDILETEELSGIRTVVASRKNKTEPPVYYAAEQMTRQLVTSNGLKHTFLDDFRLKCLETALAYSNITLDLFPVTYPQSEDEQWQKMMKQIAPNVSTGWQDYSDFAKTTLSESDARIRRFLALDFGQERKDDVIRLNVENFDGQAWFLLRTNGERVDSVEGGTYCEIEEGIYLLAVEQETVSVRLEKQSGFYYQSGRERDAS